MSVNSDIWVYLETTDGKLCNVGIELLGESRILADKSGGRLVAVIIDVNAGELASEAIAYGADRVITVTQEQIAAYTTEYFTQALCSLVKKYFPNALIIGATSQGRDLAPRLACRLRTGLTADCTSLDIDDDAIVLWTRPAFGGNIMATNICPDQRPQMGTVRPNVFKKPEKCEGRAGIVTSEQICFEDSDCLTKLEEILGVINSTTNLVEADIIVSGGRGMKNAENFAILERLADAIGGSVGASRAAVDSGWISQSHQVGQTGKTVSPKIYIACGISGAIQHQIGMSSSDVIIAINKDAGAPIFDIADFGIVGDLFEIVPALTDAILLRAEKSRG